MNSNSKTCNTWRLFPFILILAHSLSHSLMHTLSFYFFVFFFAYRKCTYVSFFFLEKTDSKENDSEQENFEEEEISEISEIEA